MLLKILIVSLFLWTTVKCANILAILPTPSQSHHIGFTDLWTQLVLKGHNVVLVTAYPGLNPVLPNLTEISLGDSMKLWESKLNSIKESGDIGLFGLMKFFLQLSNDLVDYDLSQDRVKDLIYNKQKYNFDLVVVEQYYPQLLAFGKIYNCPTIILGPIGASVQMLYVMGNPTHPLLNHDMNLPYLDMSTFKQRLISTVFYWHMMLYTYSATSDMQKIIDKHFPDSNANTEELLDNIDFMLVNENPLLKGVTAVGPNIVFVRGGNQLKPLKPLPTDLKKFLDSAKEGFIYFSLGGNIKSKDLKFSKLKTFIETLKELPYKVLWKFETEDLPEKLENVKLVKWAPQQDVLRHPNIKLFISQGGIISLEESIMCHVPMVILPFYGDQIRNAKIVESKGIGRSVEHDPVLLKEDFKGAILEVITNTQYKESVTKLAHLMQDQPMTGVEQSVWWTEYVIRNKGAKHLRNLAADLPLYQYFLLDVFGFFLLIIILVTVILLMIVKIILRVLRYFIHPVKKVKSKKND